MASRMAITLLDYDGDKKTTSFEGVTGTAGNFAAQETLRAALITAIQGITLGNTSNTTFSAVVTDFAVSTPSDPFAQVNVQWIVEYVDDVTSLTYTTSIGTADLDLTDTIYNGAPALNIGASGAGEAFKDALEAWALHNGNAITVTAIYFRE